jgi:hypothetical protein
MSREGQWDDTSARADTEGFETTRTDLHVNPRSPAPPPTPLSGSAKGLVARCEAELESAKDDRERAHLLF